MKTGHVLIIGQTESGKSICGKKIAASYRSQSIKVCVLDPHMDPGWGADYITDDPAQFMALVRDPSRCTSCSLFIDESGQMLDRYSDDCDWLTTQARHFGHCTHIIAQRAQQISRNVRAQCTTLFAFNVAPEDARTYASDFNCPELLKCPTLPQGHCIRVQRFQGVRYLRMW